MWVYVASVIMALLSLLIGYILGYRKGCIETAFCDNKLGNEVFENAVWFGASVARDNPNASLISIAGLVRKKKDQLKRLTMDELAALRSVEFKETPC